MEHGTGGMVNVKGPLGSQAAGGTGQGIRTGSLSDLALGGVGSVGGG